jgi:hypothetical protein
MARALSNIAARVRWICALAVLLGLTPVGPVGADAAALTAFPNPVMADGASPGTTTISWDSGDLGIIPELWLSVDNAPATLYLRLPQPRGNVPYGNVRPGHTYTFFLYTPNKGRLLASGVAVSGLQTIINYGTTGYSLTPQLPQQRPGQPGHCANLCTNSLSPSRTYWTYRMHDDINGVFCGDLPLFGTAGYPQPSAGEIAVGYQHFYDPGTDPLPCSHTVDAFFRGAVRFDLSDFTNNRFIGAKLTFRVKESARHYDVGGLNVGESGTWSAAAAMDRATDNWLIWPAPSDHDYINGDGSQHFVSPEHPDDPEISLDVSGMVRDWLRAATPNYGFVFYGKDEGYPENNDVLTSIYGDFVLTLTYG